MRNKIFFLGCFILVFLIIFSVNVNAASISVSNSNPTVGDNVTVTVYFGTTYSATVEITGYPNNFSINDSTVKTYWDTTGGSSPISSMSFSFTANSCGSGNFSAVVSGMSDIEGDVIADAFASSSTITVSAPITIEEEENDEPYYSEDYEVEDEDNTEVVSTPKPTQAPKSTDVPKPNEEEDSSTELEEPEKEVIPLALSSLAIKGYELFPNFSKDIKEYEVNITDLNTIKIDIEAVANREDSSIVITGNDNIKFGENIISILLKTDDDKENIEYTIKARKVTNDYKEEYEKARDEIILLNNKIKSKDNIIKISITVLVIIIIADVTYVFLQKKSKNK